MSKVTNHHLYAPKSGKLIQSDGTIINEADGINEDGSRNVQLAGSIIQQPTEIQSRYAQTVQTHNAVSVPTNTWSHGQWMDVSGFDKVAVTMMNSSGSTQNAYNIQWSHDSSTIAYDEALGTPSTTALRGTETSIKARYCRVSLLNQDANSRTMSAWAYLKA
jgi:hypothetical protein